MAGRNKGPVTYYSSCLLLYSVYSPGTADCCLYPNPGFNFMFLIPCWDGIDYALQNLSSAPGRAAINRSFKGSLVNSSGHYWNVSQGLSAVAPKYWFIVRCSRDDYEKVTTSLLMFDDQEGEIASIYWCFRPEFIKLVSGFIAQKTWADTTCAGAASTVRAGSI